MFYAEEHKLHHQIDGFAAARCVLIKFKGGLDHGRHQGTPIYPVKGTTTRGWSLLQYAAGTSCVLIKLKGGLDHEKAPGHFNLPG